MKTCNDVPVGYTDHPPAGEWQGWNGGVCPVHPLATVEYVMAGGSRCRDDADQLDWEHSGNSWDIVAYRIVEEYKAPEPERVAREIWLSQGYSQGFWIQCGPDAYGATLFREVLE